MVRREGGGLTMFRRGGVRVAHYFPLRPTVLISKP